MRLSVTINGRSLTVDIATQREPSQPDEPDRQGATCGDTERADAWDHDTRSRIGFEPPRYTPP